MVFTCPRCHRSLSSVSADAQPLFCMYCGQKLTGSTGPTAGMETQTFTPQEAAGLSGVSDDDAPYTPDTLSEGAHRGMPRAPEPAPKEVGGYKLVKLLGAGGMGTVYEAEAPGTGNRVAVKLLSSRLTSNPASVERFRQEGRLASQLTHPRCVFVLSADTENGRPYIVMELMPGRTLKDLIDERGPMSANEAVARVLDVIDGLTEAHRVGVIHRDVKPSNCFLTADDRVKVGDFGLSKSLTGTGRNHLTETGAFLGTVLFASPEQIRGEPLDYSSDVYSVAATLYFLLTGQAPFHHENAATALAKAISDPAPRVRAKRPDVPPRLEQIILRGLERDRARRWQALDDLREALVDLLPERQRPARPRALVAAYFLDILFVAVVLLTPLEMAQKAFGVLRLEVVGVHINFVGWALAVAHFALLEGLTGTTVGKALLGLRVVRVGQTGPPGVWRATVRAVVFALIWMWIFDGSRLAVMLVASGSRAVGGGFSLFTLGTGFAALAIQLWKQGGFRGLHDFASGCRVTQKPLGARKLRLAVHQPTPLQTVLPPSGHALPEVVGGYAVRARLSADSGGQVWLAEDRSLGRSVLLWLRPWGSLALGADPARPTRLRRLGTGSLAWGGSAFDWVAYAAPLGGPLVEAVRPDNPLPWADARYLLEQLAEEFRAAEVDGSTPPRLALDHIWVEPNGRVQVLDFPLCAAHYKPNAPLAVLRQAAALAIEGQPRAGGGSVLAPLPAHALQVLNRLFATELPLAEFQKELAETHAHQPEVTSATRAAHLGIQAPLLALPLTVMFAIAFALSLFLAMETTLQAEHAKRAADALAQPEELAKLIKPANPAIASSRTKARVNELLERTRANAEARRGQLFLPQRLLLTQTEQIAARAAGPALDAVYANEAKNVLLWASAPDKTPLGRANSPWASGLMSQFAVLILIPVGLVVFAALARGGVSMMLAGVTIVRADGRPALRRQCALRAALVWVPVALLLVGSCVLQVYAPDAMYFAAVLWLLAVALMPVYAVLALRFPVRPPQDRLAGTSLVPV